MDLVPAHAPDPGPEPETSAEELGRLEAELAERELELATRRAELHAFEALYLRVVGLRYAELDGLEAEVAAFLASRSPADRGARQRAEEARQRAEESERAWEQAVGAGEAAAGFAPSEDLRKLYRRVAKRVHPDLADDEEDQLRRQGLMAEANRAYAEGDAGALRALLADVEAEDDGVAGEEEADLDALRLAQRLGQVRHRLRAIADELRALDRSELAELYRRVEGARRAGVDLLAEIGRALDGQIASIRRRLRALREGADPWIDAWYAAATRAGAEAGRPEPPPV